MMMMMMMMMVVVVVVVVVMDDDADVEEEDQSQGGEAHFAQARVVAMHVDTSQDVLRAEIYWENAAVQSQGKHLARDCAVEMHTDMSQQAFARNLQGKCRMPQIIPPLNTL